MADMLKLNLGAGPFAIEGYAPIEIHEGQNAYPLKYPDGSVDEIRASHVFEHFSHRLSLLVLKEWARALKPNGWLKIAVPDFDYLIRAYTEGIEGPHFAVEGILFGGHADGYDVHKSLWTKAKLTAAFKAVGLCDTKPWKSEIQDCASMSSSLNLMARKPEGWPVDPGSLTVSAVMSVPRLGFMDNFFCMYHTLLPLGIKVRRHTGAFWGQCLTRAVTETLAEQKPDAILTVDYDTIFSIDDVKELIRLMLMHPDADAIVPIQAARWRKEPLLVIHDEDGKPRPAVPREAFDEELTRIHYGHFGLTLIRRRVFETLPQPWFKGVPDEATGEWNENKIDDDAWFWKQFNAAGKKAYLANRVPVGHAELCVMWPDVNMEPAYQTVRDWTNDGKPAGAWR